MGKSKMQLPQYSDDWQGIWHRDAYSRIEQLKKHGAKARLFLEKADKLWVLRACVKNRKAKVPRLSLPWQHHISICFDGECTPALLDLIKDKWHGKRVRLRFSHFGKGGSGAGAIAGAVAECPLIRRAHKFGWYSDRDLHISF